MPAKGCLLIVRLIILESRCQSFQKQRMVGRKLIRRGQLSNQLRNLSNITDNRISNFKRRFFILHGVSRIKTLLLILYHSIAHFINQKVAEITKRSPFMATFKHWMRCKQMGNCIGFRVWSLWPTSLPLIGVYNLSTQVKGEIIYGKWSFSSQEKSMVRYSVFTSSRWTQIR